jgi:hypothetical protein
VVNLMAEWRTWRITQWNERLLEHFFGRSDDSEGPVVVLLVTSDELVRVTNDRDASASEVRDAFVAVVQATFARVGSFLADASDYQGWPGPPADDVVPRFVSHLIFTCVAASESSDDLASEGSYLARLRDLTEDQLPDYSIQSLPRLWENLAGWLSAPRNQLRFRRLKLPEPGALTRIGYTVKLAFPDRRDQRQLSELLQEAGLAGQEPPIGKVLSLVSSARSRFRQPFLNAFDEFRSNINATTPYADMVEEHRFWAAVREAALRGRRVDEVPAMRARAQILCEEQDDRLFSFVVTDEPVESVPGMITAELPLAYGQWRFAMLPQEFSTIELAALNGTMSRLLEGKLLLPRISPLVVQGVLPMIASSSGLLELATSNELQMAQVALVREDLAEDLVRIYGRASPTINFSNHKNWVEIRGLELHKLPSEKLEATSLRRCWMLHESLVDRGIHVMGGVRADDGWLGIKEVLPKIVMAGDGQIFLEDSEANTEALLREEDGSWKLPDRDLIGAFRLIAKTQLKDRTIRFVGGLASENFRLPADPESWIVEGLGGTATLAASAPYSTEPMVQNAPAYDRGIYLGPIVGQFVGSPDDAAWRVSKFGGVTFGARCRVDLAASPPPARAPLLSARRRWRKLLLHSEPDPADPGFVAARRANRRWFIAANLPTLDVPDRAPSATQSSIQPLASVDRLLRVVSGRASNRTGLPWSEWASLVQELLGVERERVAAITRAWAEAGTIEVGSFARWRQRCVFPRPPILAAFRIGDAVGATIMGMMLRETRQGMIAAAKREGILFEDRMGVSRFGPSTLTFRTSGIEKFESLCRSMGTTLIWLDIDLSNYAAQVRHDGLTPAPLNYDYCRQWTNWSLQDVTDRTAIVFEHWLRSGRPDYWKVSRGELSIWSYDLNTARLWAAALIGEPLSVADGAGDLAASHGFVPLPLARMLAVLGAGLSGPDELWRYRYPASSLRLSGMVLNVLQRTFDPRRLLDLKRTTV